MSRNLVFAGIMAGFTLFFGVTRVEAQVVTVNANYAAAQGMFPAVAQPSGTISVPQAMPQPKWRVTCDYGTLPAGAWAPWAGGPQAVNSPVNNVPGAGGVVNWNQAGTVPMTGAPANLYVRAILQKQVVPNGAWIDVHTAYNTVN